MQSYSLKQMQNLRGSLLSCELKRLCSWSATNCVKPEVLTSCATSRLNPEVHSHLFLYDFRALMLECSGLNGEKASDWLRLCHATAEWCSS